MSLVENPALPPGVCVRCGKWAERIIPAWWLRDPVTEEPGGGLCSPCCELHCTEEDAKPKKGRRR